MPDSTKRQSNRRCQNLNEEAEQEEMPEPWLLLTPPHLLGKLWPHERVLAGLCVCKNLKVVLLENACDLHLGFGAQSAEHKQEQSGKASHLAGKIEDALQQGDVGLMWTRREVKSHEESRTLVHLDLGLKMFGDERISRLMAALSSCTPLALAHADLSGNCISPIGAKHLARVLQSCTALRSLDLSSNYIGPGGMARLQVLKHCTELRCLELTGNQFGPHGAASLALPLTHCTNITRIGFAWNNILDQGATSLAQALALCVSLEDLDLEGNRIGDAGATSLSQTMPQCSALLRLDFRSNPTLGEARRMLVKALPSVHITFDELAR